MGVLLIVLGLAAAGVVTDFVVENHLATAARQSVELFGQSFGVSIPKMVVAAAVLGAAAVLFVTFGVGMLRGSWGRRRNLKRRVAELERENTELQSKVRLSDTVRAEQERRGTGATEGA